MSLTLVQPFTYKPLAINDNSWLAPLRRLSLPWFRLPFPKTFAVCWLTFFALGVAAPLRVRYYTLHPTRPDERMPTGIFWESATPAPPPSASQLQTFTLVDGWQGANNTSHANATRMNASAGLQAGTSRVDAAHATGSSRRLARLRARQHSL